MKFHHYTVTGSGIFPLDMLRYDAAWPTDTNSVLRMEDDDKDLRVLHLASIREPTKERWRSFGWQVVSHRSG
jgi:hypothetical protein